MRNTFLCVLQPFGSVMLCVVIDDLQYYRQQQLALIMIHFYALPQYEKKNKIKTFAFVIPQNCIWKSFLSSTLMSCTL